MRAVHSGLAMTVPSQLMHFWGLLCSMLVGQRSTFSLGTPSVSQLPFVSNPVTSIFKCPLEPPAALLKCIFPWVEQEQEQLAQRQASSSKSVDIALKQFLRLLIWLRRVLLQDCAILFSKYPSCPMFRYPPFNSPTFHQFAATSLSVVDHAEEEVHHALKNLPEHVATTFRGLASGIKMDQHSQRIDSDAR